MAERRMADQASGGGQWLAKRPRPNAYLEVRKCDEELVHIIESDEAAASSGKDGFKRLRRLSDGKRDGPMDLDL